MDTTVFITHAQEDEALAGALSNLLRHALGLPSAGFFDFTQLGRGVSPSESIRDKIRTELSAVAVHVVLVTPNSANSQWVWFEVGHRFAVVDKGKPIFVVPSNEHVELLKPVSDLRVLCLDSDNDLHDLVETAASLLNIEPVDLPEYIQALKNVIATAGAYAPKPMPPPPGRAARALTFVKSQSGGLTLGAGLALVVAALLWSMASGSTGSQVDPNSINVSAAQQFLVLKGLVVKADNSPVPDALVIVSRGGEELNEASCKKRERQCASIRTRSKGEFTIDLVQIQATKGETLVLSVIKDKFDPFTQDVDVDVRAMDVSVAPQPVITLTPKSSVPRPRP
jgi:hypothetical protein